MHPRAQIITVSAEHLATVNAAGQSLQRRLQRSALMPVGDHSWCWMQPSNDSPSVRVELSAGGERVDLLVAQDLPLNEPVPTDWRRCQGALRALAWTAAHETFLDLLQHVLGSDVDVLAVHTNPGDARAEGSFANLGFAVHDAHDVNMIDGQLRLPRACAVRADRRVPWQAVVPHSWPLKLAFEIEIDRCELPADAVATLQVGALLRLTNTTLTHPSARVVLTLGEWRVPADFSCTTLTVAENFMTPPALDISNLQGIPTMTESIDVATQDSDTTATRGETQGIAVGALPVSIRCCAGQVALPLGAVQTLEVGQTIALETTLHNAPITLWANDVAIARGDLVLIGDLLGVRIARLLAATH